MACRSSWPELNETNLSLYLKDLTKWKLFGTHLRGMKPSELDKIEIDKSGVEGRKLQLYDKWLESCPGEPPSWEDVVKALEKSDHYRIARKVKKELGMGTVVTDTGYSESVTETETLDVYHEQPYLESSSQRQQYLASMNITNHVRLPVPATDSYNNYEPHPAHLPAAIPRGPRSNHGVGEAALYSSRHPYQIKSHFYYQHAIIRTNFYKNQAKNESKIKESYIQMNQEIQKSYEELSVFTNHVVRELEQENNELKERLEEKDRKINELEKKLEHVQRQGGVCTCRKPTQSHDSMESLSETMRDQLRLKNDNHYNTDMEPEFT